MKTHYALIVAFAACLFYSQSVHAYQQPTAFGSGFDVQDFYRPFTLEEITPANQQKWPFYKHVAVHWDKYAGHGTAKIMKSAKPTKLTVADDEDRVDLNTKWKDGQAFIDSLMATQVKGFIVVKDNKILAEFYDNGYNVGKTNLMQSASKTFAAVVIHRLVDQGLLDPKAKVETYLKDFKGTGVGVASIEQVLDMASGIPEEGDYHTPGAPGYVFEVETGMKPGKSVGHRKTIKSTNAVKKPGEAWFYSDKNTDTLGLVAEHVSGKKMPELLSEVFDEFGAKYDGSIADNSDHTSSACYGISISLRDYALFHQWLAQGKGPKSYYASARDVSKTKIQENEFGALYSKGTPITYGSQTWYLAEHDILMSYGSYGQVGLSDMKTGVAVIFQQDWAVNTNFDKFYATRDLALAVIQRVTAASAESKNR